MAWTLVRNRAPHFESGLGPAKGALAELAGVFVKPYDELGAPADNERTETGNILLPNKRRFLGQECGSRRTADRHSAGRSLDPPEFTGAVRPCGLRRAEQREEPFTWGPRLSLHYLYPEKATWLIANVSICLTGCF